MKVEGFPNCCGAYVITGFHSFITSPDEEEKKLNERMLKQQEKQLDGICKAYKKYAFLMAILSPDQVYMNDMLLSKYGFVWNRTGRNGVHNTELHFYIKAKIN